MSSRMQHKHVRIDKNKYIKESKSCMLRSPVQAEKLWNVFKILFIYLLVIVIIISTPK